MAFQFSIFIEDLQTAFDAVERLAALVGDGQRSYGIPHRLDAVRRPPRPAVERIRVARMADVYRPCRTPYIVDRR